MEEPKIIELDETNTCKICTNALAKYTCPRCNILYCSLTCYQSIKHVQCTEQFYHESVMTELRTQDKDPAMKQKMLDILNKVHASDHNEPDIDSDDDEETPDLAERLANVDLNDVKTIWSLLTADEKQEFESLVRSGDVTKLVPLWIPWWEQHVKKPLVQELHTNLEPDYIKSCPKVMENIKLFQSLTKVKPSDCVKYNVVNTIAAYTCTVRYFNGDHFDFSNEAVYLLMCLSKNLHSSVNFESYSLALESVHQLALVNEWMSTDTEVKSKIYKDIEHILQGPEYSISTAVCDSPFLLKAKVEEMDSLANYGSDDDYEENSNDKMGTYKSGQSQPWQHTSAPTEADVNYDEVQMDLSEESNNNNSNEEGDVSPRPNRTTNRKRSHRSRSRDDTRVKSLEHRSSRKDWDDERDRTRKHESKAKYDRDGASGNQERAKYERDSHEDRHDKSKYDRTGQNSYEDRHDKTKYDRDTSHNYEDRSKPTLSHVEDRHDRSKYSKDDKSNRNREERTRKHRSGSKDRRRSGSKERRRSSSRERIEIKTPDSEFVTPQMLLQRSMDEQVQKVKHTTGIELPKYYNPAAMNPARYADQIQKRRLLWQKKDAVPAVPVQPLAQPATVSKVWEQTTFAQDQDGKVASKFKRLMGIRDTPATVTGPTGGREILKKQEEMFSSMEQQYEVARTATHTMRGVGLGFGTFQSYPR
ncbi:uncharacterized protein CBL_12937 [Carabus blaptoides fortunei]